jgi:Arc/MetJ-type ribon-helix-helix transcriptional regulator
MKLSVSLPEDDVAFLDRYAASQGMTSRSAAVHRAVRLLHAVELGAAYEDAWGEWTENEDSELWDVTSADGLS